jgi:hypothetical protein
LHGHNRPRNGAQALVSAALTLEAVGEHGHLVLNAAPFADELRPHDWAVHDALSGGLRIEPVGQRVESGARRGLEAPVSEFLDPVREPADEVVAAEAGRLRAEGLASLVAELRQQGERKAA